MATEQVGLALKELDDALYFASSENRELGLLIERLEFALGILGSTDLYQTIYHVQPAVRLQRCIDAVSKLTGLPKPVDVEEVSDVGRSS